MFANKIFEALSISRLLISDRVYVVIVILNTVKITTVIFRFVFRIVEGLILLRIFRCLVGLIAGICNLVNLNLVHLLVWVLINAYIIA